MGKKSKKEEGRTAARTIITALKGKKVSDCTKAEQEKLLTALAHLLNVVDETGKVITL